jgi:hypothetical protein
MKKTPSLLLPLIITSTPTLALAQSGGDAAGCALAAFFIIIYILILAVCMAIPIALIIFIVKWIRKDATSRGMPNADTIKWLGLLGLLGLVIYLLQRPQPNISPCPSCGQSRMQGLPVCPHCGNA